ncbi:hypothetical protein ABEB36_011650 [Hypothenemus hampei]|uniref:Uncharacterized protein n=1 Tax=Hypothenemus hampei TaxID=57062 RepID=A0ABD1E8J5_HYPHA
MAGGIQEAQNGRISGARHLNFRFDCQLYAKTPGKSPDHRKFSGFEDFWRMCLKFMTAIANGAGIKSRLFSKENNEEDGAEGEIRLSPNSMKIEKPK